MADEDINPVVLLEDPKVNHRVWAACLKWTPVVKKQRVPSHHKHKSHVKPRRLTSLKVTVGSRNSRGKNRNTDQARTQSLFFPGTGFLLMGQKWIRCLPVQR